MPTYTYECVVCAHKFDATQYTTDRPLEACPKCKTGKDTLERRQITHLTGSRENTPMQGFMFKECG